MAKKKIKSFQFKNLILLGMSLYVSYLLYENEAFHFFLLHLGRFGYAGAFIAGVLFVSTFTAPTGILILLILAEQLSVFEIGLVAGVGAVVGDILIFKFVKNNLSKEISSLYSFFDRDHHLKKLLKSRYFSWSLPVVGAILIASPLPDEIGISLLGLSKLNTIQFIFLSFCLNTIGIIGILLSSYFIKP